MEELFRRNSDICDDAPKHERWFAPREINTFGNLLMRRYKQPIEQDIHLKIEAFE
jgi:hypothetical protein